MTKELYVISLEGDYSFIDDSQPDLKCLRDRHMEFITKIQEVLPSFDIPYLALFPDGQFCSPQSLYPTILDSGNVTKMRMGLVGLVEELLTETPVEKAITAIVEFSETELYPNEIEQLARKYEIKRLVLDS